MNEPLLYKIVRPILKGLFILIYNPTYKGLENIPKDGRIILAGNHKKNFDCILLISSTKRVIHFLGKSSLFKGMKKIIFKQMGVIPVNREIKDKNCLIEARKVLEHEQVIGIFPEGTTNKTNEIIMPFKMGAIKLSFDTDAYIVPFAITGEYKRSKLMIEFGVPYQLDGNDLDIEKEKLEKIIIEMLGDKHENN